MEKNCPAFQSFTCPLLKSEMICQEVDVFLFEFVRHFIWLWLTERLQSLSADVLHSIVTYAQGCCDFAVSKIFVRSCRRIRAPEPEKQHCLLYFGLLLSRILFKMLHRASCLYYLFEFYLKKLP